MHATTAARGPSADKAVVGALDSACNRTCAGEPWIVELLREAPIEVQALVTTEPETEQFKFGNGGILPSTLRWRLPIMMAGELVLLWVSSVPVATLGLLIGRDVLDAVGGILDFSERTLSCRAFGAKTARLLQLSAGHLALPLIPESWPLVPKTRWRKLGPDGVLETVIGCKQWAQQLLRGVSHAAPGSEEHSHNMTEASLTLGQIAFEYNSTLLTTAQRMCTEVVPAIAPVASSSVAVRPKDGGGAGFRRSAFASSWLRWAWLPRRRRRRGPRVASHQPLAQDDHASASALGLGQRGFALGFGKAARLALLTVSLALGLFGGYVEKPGRDDVPAWGLSSSLVGPWAVDGEHPGIDDLVSRPLRAALCLPGGPVPARHVGSDFHTWPGSSSQGGDGEGSGGGSVQGGRPTQGGSVFDRSTGRPTDLEGGLATPSFASQRDRGREGQGGRPQGQDSSDAWAAQGRREGRLKVGSGTLHCFYELLLAPFVETHAAYLDQLAFAIGGPGFLADFGTHARGRPRREHECFHVVHGGNGPPISGDAGRGQRPAANHAQPGAPARDADAERPAGDRHRDGGRHGLVQRAPAGARGERERQPPDGPSSGTAGLPTGAVVSKLKPGQRQLITQAWARHRREQLLISCTQGQVRHALTAEYFADCRRALNETFVFEVPLLAAEAVAPLDVVSRQALVRGHTIAGPWLHGSEFDLTLRQDRRRVLDNMLLERPYFVVLTVPDRSWLPPARLRQHPDDLRQQRAEALLLLNFAARLAREQVRGGRHFVLRHFVFRLPLASAAWRAPAMRRLKHGLGLHFVTVGAHRILTSSQAVVSYLLRKDVAKACLETRVGLSRALVVGFEMEFDYETQCLSSRSPRHECYQMTAVPGAVDFYHEALAVDEGDQDFAIDDHPDTDEEPVEEFKGEITPAIRAAVKRVHEATGHKPPKRLARALLLSGAPPAAVQAARELKCDVCAERRAPRARRVAGLPAPRAVGEQAHVDLLVAEDAVGRTYVIAHVTDAVSKFQQAALLPDKSAASVIDFLMTSWVPLLGTPRQMIADQGREFVAAEDWCSAHSVLLWHAAVQAPWQNGLAERSGGLLKALLAAVVTDKVVIGERGMRHAIAEAVAAYNADPTAEGVSPLQCVTGRQPSGHGSVLNNFAGHLAQHGLIDSDPNLMERLALRESARIAMVRLHYSQSIRKAELARSREPTSGDVVYFWRAQKLTRRGDPRVSTSSRRRRLELRRWHGPAVLIALEASGETNFPTNAFLSYKGQVTKCALEHVRPASSLEQLAAGTWEEAIRELVEDTSNARGGSALPSVPEGEPVEEDVVPVVLGNAALDERLPSPLPPSASTSSPSTAAPGTPVGNLLQRPLLQHALQRAQGQPLAVQLGARALSRGQPGDFQAELRDAMERGMRRRTSSEAGLEDRADVVRRGSNPMSDVQGAVGDASETAVPPRPSNESPGGPSGFVEAAVPRPSSESPGGPSLVSEAAVPRPSSESPGGPSDVLAGTSSTTTRGAFEAMTLTMEQLSNLSLPAGQVHPLLRVQAQVEQDRQSSRVNLEEERDHGTWDGRWSLPSRSQFEAVQSLGAPLPSGLPEDHEVSAATARKEHQWGHMTAEERKLWHKAAEKGWQAYVDNEAVQVLNVKESAAIRKQLAARGELDRILVPRFVLTDKADGLRSESNPMPVDASARLVVPGFKDRANLNGEVRRDAPTGARLTQHLLLCIIASKGKLWKMLSADVKSAFLKGDPCVSRELYITKTNPRVGPEIPIPEGCLARVCKGIFGLADAPREWWLRLSPLDQASWFLWDSTERKELRGMIVSHVDDLLFGGDHVAEASLLDVGAELGFREVQVDDFTWCDKRFQRRADGSVTLSMESYHRNLKEIPLSRQRKASLTAPSPLEGAFGQSSVVGGPAQVRPSVSGLGFARRTANCRHHPPGERSFGRVSAGACVPDGLSAHRLKLGRLGGGDRQLPRQRHPGWRRRSRTA